MSAFACYVDRTPAGREWGRTGYFSMDLKLVVVQGKPKGKEIPILVSPFLIGRGAECHLRPNNELVSRRHCVLTIHGQEVRIRELGSSNGTIVNGERLTEELTLCDGDLIQVGTLCFEVKIQGVAVPAKPAAAPSTPAPVLPARPDQLAAKETAPDDITQWLISDSKGESPLTKSGVYSGLTHMGVHVDGEPASPDATAAPAGPAGAQSKKPAEKLTSTEDGSQPTAGEDKQKSAQRSQGAAAHAADEIIRRMMERRPHK